MEQLILLRKEKGMKPSQRKLQSEPGFNKGNRKRW
jgi:hypothetical protein